MTDSKEPSLIKLLNLIENHSITAYEISKNTGLSSVGVQKIIDGKTKKPSISTINTILDYINNQYLLDKSNIKESVISSDDIQDYIFEKASLESKLKMIFEQNTRIIKQYTEIKDLVINQVNEGRDNKNVMIEYVEMSLQPIMEYIGMSTKKKENK